MGKTTLFTGNLEDNSGVVSRPNSADKWGLIKPDNPNDVSQGRKEDNTLVFYMDKDRQVTSVSIGSTTDFELQLVDVESKGQRRTIRIAVLQ